MAEKVVMPKFGMGMQEGTIAEWLKKENDVVEKGEPLVTISSEKITNELEAPSSGVLKIEAVEDETIQVGHTLAYIGEEGENLQAGLSSYSSPSKQEKSVQKQEDSAVMTKTTPAAIEKKRVKISPAAKKLAKTNDIDFTELKGTGPKGRITKQDVQDYLGWDAFTEKRAEKRDAEKETINQAIPVKGMRKVIADRMQHSLQESAQLTLMKKADITELLEIQKQAKQDLQAGRSSFTLTLTAFIARATVKALLKHKAVNSAYLDGVIHTYNDIHLGMATSLDEGLVVPVVFHAEKQGVFELAESIHLLSQKARAQKLSNDQLKGSTFTITNLGASGIEFFTPILNSPEAGILGVGAYQQSLVLADDEVEERSVLPLSLTFDHRTLDGAPASSFLKDIVFYLEHPYQMLL
ncbi:dihydrolipoamide acetyltransferase family protein [Halobacillus karajensis]|uniref:Dihydrolipoamide acetyltransferase component of pyruvate dehydrogenase complex n=1 Tax=Halobacillus karajensis TaxID=195088 RepID=A0A024P685_9BACI|nr:dihydrolipoamide acetyltransferase family protein [Halobacillus karajensis]CDQ24564.1 Dihydrolipoyllysine-residue acetyltransferase component of pyruvate dehydrogenase complex [Halobacillus karajensis]